MAGFCPLACLDLAKGTKEHPFDPRVNAENEECCDCKAEHLLRVLTPVLDAECTIESAKAT